MAQVISLKVRIEADGTAVLERATAGVDRFGRETDEAAASTRRLAAAQDASALAAKRLLGAISGLVGAGALGVLLRESYQYNQELESTRIGIAGLLNANREYLGTQDQWGAALAESSELLKQIQVEALKTKATVPQLGDVFATAFGATTAAGLKATNSEILQMSTRLMQVGNAFNVPIEQMRQEVNSLIGGMITEDSLIAKRLGFTNKDVKAMQQNGKFIAELIQRTESYAKAAEAQSNTLSGKLMNTREVIVATVSRSLEPVGEAIKNLLDQTFGWFQANGNAIAIYVQRIIAGITIAIENTAAWARENKDLIGDIVVLAATFAGVQSAMWLVDNAIKVATSSAGKFAITLIAIALLYEGLRKLGPIEIGGSTVAGYFSAIATALVGTVWAIVKTLVGVIKIAGHGLWSLVMQFFSDLGGAFKNVGSLLGIESLEQAGLSIEQFYEKAAGNFGKFAAKTIDDVGEAGEAVVDATVAAFGAKDLPSLGDLAKKNLGGVVEAINSMLPQFDSLGKKIDEKLFQSIAKPGTAKAAAVDGAAQKAADKLDSLIDQYTRFINDYRAAAAAGGDPLSEELAKIEAQRADALVRFEELQEQLKKALGVKFDREQMKADYEAIMSFFDEKGIDAAAESLRDLNSRTLAAARSRYEQETDFAIEEQRRQNAKRLDLIDDAGARELASRMASIEEWFDAERARILATVDIETQRDAMLENLRRERAKRDEFAADEVKRTQAEQLVGTREWAKKVAREIGSIPDAVTRAVGSVRVELSDFFGEVLDSFVTGQEDIGKSFEDLITAMARNWSRILSDMLTKTIVSGESIVTQLKEVWGQLGAAGAKGPMDAGLAGAGVGAMVGSIFGGPNNYGAVGGTIGGGVGAAIGAAIAGYFTGGAGAAQGAQIGAAVGSVIGTVVGSMIQKGKDQIKVAIVDGVATVTEAGISWDARRDITIQVQRRVDEEMDAWRSILDLFPERVKDALANLPPPRVDLTGGVEQGDLTDENALGALGDFLGNDLPEAVFKAYERSLRTAFGAMGVTQARIQHLMEYWGTLQGKELQDSVRLFAVTLIEAVEMRDLLDQDFSAHIDEARRRTDATPMTAMQDITDEIAKIVASAETMTDVDDIISAQQRVTQLERQRYEMLVQYLQHIDAVQKEVMAGIEAQREQINLAGMDEQEKMDYFYAQLGSLFDQLRFATDPDEIRRLTQEMNSYISQALGLDPNDEENREKLLQILADMEFYSDAGLDAARKAAEAAAEEARELQQRMVDILQGILDAVGGGPDGGDDDDDGDGDGDGDDDDDGGDPPDRKDPPGRPRDQQPNADSALIAQTIATMQESQAQRFEQMFAAEQSIVAAMPKPADFAIAIREALEGAELTTDEPLTVDLGDFGEAIAATVQRRLQLTLQRNRDAFTPRT